MSKRKITAGSTTHGAPWLVCEESGASSEHSLLRRMQQFMWFTGDSRWGSDQLDTKDKYALFNGWTVRQVRLNKGYTPRH